MMLSDVCLSVAYVGPKSRTERPRKTKIGTEVAHVTRDSDTIFKVKTAKVKVTGAGILWRPPAQLVESVLMLVPKLFFNLSVLVETTACQSWGVLRNIV